MDGLSSRGAESSRGAFTRGPDLFGVQSVLSQEFLRSHQKEPPGSCPQGPQVPQPSPCVLELFSPVSGSSRLAPRFRSAPWGLA